MSGFSRRMGTVEKLDDLKDPRARELAEKHFEKIEDMTSLYNDVPKEDQNIKGYREQTEVEREELSEGFHDVCEMIGVHYRNGLRIDKNMISDLKEVADRSENFVRLAQSVYKQYIALAILNYELTKRRSFEIPRDSGTVRIDRPLLTKGEMYTPFGDFCVTSAYHVNDLLEDYKFIIGNLKEHLEEQLKEAEE